MTRRVEFWDGEGILEEDLNLIAKLGDRSAYRGLRQAIQTAVTEVGADYPLLLRGGDPSHSGTGTRTITLTGSVWCAAEDSPPAAASDAPEVYVADTAGAAYVLDANTSGSVWRRDILEVKIEPEDTVSPESRDFEDSATRALSTQSFEKRRTRAATIQVRKGTDQASEAAADAAEPSPTAGFTKIFSFLIDNTGACAAAKRKRYTVGYRRSGRFVPAITGVTVAGTAATYLSGEIQSGAASTVFVIPFEVAVTRVLRRVKVRVDATGAAAITTKVQLVADGAVTDVSTAVSNAGSSAEFITHDALDSTPSAPFYETMSYIVRCEFPGGATERVYGLFVSED